MSASEDPVGRRADHRVGYPGPSFRLRRDTGGMVGERSDFFVSHAGADRAWAEWVAWQLTEAGYEVQLDVWDWAAGQNFVTAMSDALDHCDRVVALFSAAYAARDADGPSGLRGDGDRPVCGPWLCHLGGHFPDPAVPLSRGVQRSHMLPLGVSPMPGPPFDRVPRDVVPRSAHGHT
jgi:TIR domain-containing protein